MNSFPSALNFLNDQIQNPNQSFAKNENKINSLHLGPKDVAVRLTKDPNTLKLCAFRRKATLWTWIVTGVNFLLDRSTELRNSTVQTAELRNRVDCTEFSSAERISVTAVLHHAAVQTNASQLRGDCVTFQSVVTACIVAGGDQLGSSVSVSVFVCIQQFEWDGDWGAQECWGEWAYDPVYDCVCVTQWKPTHSLLKSFIHGRAQSPASLQCSISCCYVI